MTNILVIKLRYIGDVLLATPALRALREHFPEARLTVAVNRGTEDILEWNPDINEVLVVDRGGPIAQTRFLRRIRQRRFDCVIDLTDGDRSAILSRLSGAPIRIGFNEEHRWRGLLYTSVVKLKASTVHRLERDLEAVGLLGIEPKSSPLVLQTSSGDEQEAARLLEEVRVQQSASENDRPLVMIHPGARYWFKAWPPERFAELTDRLTVALNCHVLIGGDAGDRDVAERIRTLARTCPVSLVGRTTLLQLAATLKRCALLVSNDNGPMHMAAARGIPVVALFGPSDPSVWGPRGEKVEVLYKGLDCRRCFHPTCEQGENNCMRRISVDEVFVAASRLLVPKDTDSGRA
ncbi:putative lipopolysaccharide heptosyltransferase III [Nitrospiraceae bacterium AH_259_D15_M11_P09]|nr:putative lipopolysaccharide heptosyltransferase III [Nitrospiraceae bacterium AH_259_D15_M11_P09]